MTIRKISPDEAFPAYAGAAEKYSYSPRSAGAPPTDNAAPQDKPARDVRGRFAKVDIERDVLAPNLGTPQTFAGGLRPRFAPSGDGLAQGGDTSPPAVRTAALVTGGDKRMVYASPRPAAFSGQHTGESGRPVHEEMSYLVGDTRQDAPGEVNSWPEMRPIEPPEVHPDDERHHNRVMRTAARGSRPDDPTPFLVGLDQTAPATTPAEDRTTTTYGDETGRIMSPTRAEDVNPGPRRRR